MTLRRKSREFALQLLYQWDQRREAPEIIEEHFWAEARATGETRKFAHELFMGAVVAAPELDKLITAHAANWRLERMGAIDRSLLRLGAYELRFGTAPAKVVLDEAVELAKSFSDAAAPAFVNGILDAIHKASPPTAEIAEEKGEPAEKSAHPEKFEHAKKGDPAKQVATAHTKAPKTKRRKKKE
ncbi:MAG: transcription antitermination factor NusB [Acidipila sp.]|nr:transcription antitermination factor NusB [Acidipila sp.]